MVQVVGYARLPRGSWSSGQEHELTAAGAARVFVDRAASTRLRERPEWARCLRFVQRGDTLLIRSLDRVASGETTAVRIIADLHRRGIHLRSLDAPALDTTTVQGLAIAEFATALGGLREAADLDDDGYRRRFERIRGPVARRSPVMTPERLSAARCLRRQGHTVARIAALLGVGVTTIITTFARDAQR